MRRRKEGTQQSYTLMEWKEINSLLRWWNELKKDIRFERVWNFATRLNFNLHMANREETMQAPVPPNPLILARLVSRVQRSFTLRRGSLRSRCLRVPWLRIPRDHPVRHSCGQDLLLKILGFHRCHHCKLLSSYSSKDLLLSRCFLAPELWALQQFPAPLSPAIIKLKTT